MELDELIADGIHADPILLAQDIPQEFNVSPGLKAGTAIVHLRFGGKSSQDLKLSMVNELGLWKISKIERLD